MKTIRLAAAALSILLIACRSPHYDKPTSASGSTYALGEVSEERSLYFTEAENFKEKSGGDLDQKMGASQGQCLGMRWGAKATDFVTYAVDLRKASDSALLVLRVAYEGPMPQLYDVLMDGKSIKKIELRPTGGFGYIEKEWKCFSTALGRISQGPHTLTIKALHDEEIVNIDCLVIGASR
jgi:hypothetical protein